VAPLAADAAIAALAARQWGVVSLDDLRACGLSRDAVSIRVRKGWLHPLYRTVFAVGHPNPPHEGRYLAAVKACGPDAVLSHNAAAVTWKLLDDHVPPIHVTVRGGAKRRHRGIKAHRAETLGPGEVTSHRGIPVTSPARTLIDLAAVLPERRLRRAVRRAQAEHLVTLTDLSRAVAAAKGRRGIRKLARILATRPAPTRSELEDRVLDLLLRGDIEHPDVNVPLRLAGRTVIPDFRWPAQRLVLEADGAKWHGDRLSREEDAERQALLEAHGERVVRVTWQQVTAKPAETLARIRAAGAPLSAAA
jgi:very-short-patch-repair endonuclease